MDEITRKFGEHYAGTFREHGATPKGVHWNAEEDARVRYDKMLAVFQMDFQTVPDAPSILDVGCGWGGLLEHARRRGVRLQYSGIDLVGDMIDSARRSFPDAKFLAGDVFELEDGPKYDFVVCNGIMALKLGATIPEIERYSRRLIRKMFGLCRLGIAFNMMSTRVNFMVDNLYYQNPSELLAWLLTDVSPRVRLDHGYSSLGSGERRLYEFTTYLYKD